MPKDQSTQPIGPVAGLLERSWTQALASQEHAHTDDRLDQSGRHHDVAAAGAAPEPHGQAVRCADGREGHRYLAGPWRTSKVKRPCPIGVTISRPAASGASV